MDEQAYRWRFAILRMNALGRWTPCRICGERYWAHIEAEKICGACLNRIEQMTVDLLEQIA